MPPRHATGGGAGWTATELDYGKNFMARMRRAPARPRLSEEGSPGWAPAHTEPGSWVSWGDRTGQVWSPCPTRVVYPSDGYATYVGPSSVWVVVSDGPPEEVGTAVAVQKKALRPAAPESLAKLGLLDG